MVWKTFHKNLLDIYYGSVHLVIFYYCFIVVYIYIHTYVYIYIYYSQLVHPNPCFNLFMLHNNSFDNQGSEVNKYDIFLRFDILFTKIYI